jgi:hypothetical protein
MNTPRAMFARALEIERICGGAPTREQLGMPTAEVQAAWAAHRCYGALVLARDHLRFLRQRRLQLWWLYRAYRDDRLRAKRLLRNAAVLLREAEGRLALIEMRRAA